MGFGTFDGFHPGHVFYLESLKKLGERLIVVIARDQNVERIKGKPPRWGEAQRKKWVDDCDPVDEAILGHSTDFYDVIRRHKPDVLGLGYDQKVNMEHLESLFPNIIIERVASFMPHLYKSTLLKRELGL